MLFGTEVDLGLGDIVLDGDPAPHRKGHISPTCPMSIVAKRSPNSVTVELTLGFAQQGSTFICNDFSFIDTGMRYGTVNCMKFGNRNARVGISLGRFI